MADYFPGTIKIGGKIPADLLDEFLGEVASAGLSVGDYGGPAFACTNAEELREALDEDGLLVLADDQARYGHVRGAGRLPLPARHPLRPAQRCPIRVSTPRTSRSVRA